MSEAIAFYAGGATALLLSSLFLRGITKGEYPAVLDMLVGIPLWPVTLLVMGVAAGFAARRRAKEQGSEL